MSCQSVTFSNICFDSEPITCVQSARTVEGTYCNGGTTFSTVAASYSCNIDTIRSKTSTLGCNLKPLYFSCASGTNTKSYSTATLTRVAYVTSNNCYAPLSEVHTYYEVITFREGKINSVVATGPSSTYSPRPSSKSGLGFDDEIIFPKSTDIRIIIVAVAASVVVIVAIVFFASLRRNIKKKEFDPSKMYALSPTQYPIHQLYPNPPPHPYGGVPIVVPFHNLSYEKLNQTPTPSYTMPENIDNAYLSASRIRSNLPENHDNVFIFGNDVRSSTPENTEITLITESSVSMGSEGSNVTMASMYTPGAVIIPRMKPI
ncbi:hypothetical protein HK098_001172 [Nowakowskiella sp. JEL0407]|nr:hypothetical protein HK098_001172 [Nowakowskiella sp. JEL0407]